MGSDKAPEMLIVNDQCWYNAKKVAHNCGYKDHKKALKRHVPHDNLKSFGELMGASQSWANHNLGNSHYITQAGIMALVCRTAYGKV